MKPLKMSQSITTDQQSSLINRLAFNTLMPILLVFAIASCNETPKEKLDDAATEVVNTNEELSAAKENYKDEIENYKKETNDKIAVNDQKLNDYKIKVAADKSDTKKANQKKIAELEQKNIDLKNKVNTYVDVDSRSWEIFKTQCSQDMQMLHSDVCNVCGVPSVK
jgi:hypothetical protein